MTKRFAIAPFLMIGIMMASCASGPSEQKPVEMANPASTYCVEQGGKLEIRKEAKGDAGYCHLPDGKVIEEWTFFRAKNK